MSNDKRKPAGMELTVLITEEIIAHSVARDSTHCMIADAIKASFPQAERVSVDLATIRLTDPAKRLRYTFLTPRIAQFELVRFDQGIMPTPFQFRLRGAHVTRSGSNNSRRVLTEKQKNSAQNTGREKIKKMHDVLKKTGLRHLPNGKVADRIGGKTPPVQRNKDGIPFSRRRAFGLRALNL